MCSLEDGEYDNYLDQEERCANAHLISAAPEMFEFGNEAVEIMRRIAGMVGVPYGLRDELEEQIEKWEEIKRKARGEE